MPILMWDRNAVYDAVNEIDTDGVNTTVIAANLYFVRLCHIYFGRIDSSQSRER